MYCVIVTPFFFHIEYYQHGLGVCRLIPFKHINWLYQNCFVQKEIMYHFVKTGTLPCVTKMIPCMNIKLMMKYHWSYWLSSALFLQNRTFLWIQLSVLFNSEHQLTSCPERKDCVLE